MQDSETLFLKKRKKKRKEKIKAPKHSGPLKLGEDPGAGKLGRRSVKGK